MAVLWWWGHSLTVSCCKLHELSWWQTKLNTWQRADSLSASFSGQWVCHCETHRTFILCHHSVAKFAARQVWVEVISGIHVTSILHWWLFERTVHAVDPSRMCCPYRARSISTSEDLLYRTIPLSLSLSLSLSLICSSLAYYDVHLEHFSIYCTCSLFGQFLSL